MSSHNIFINGKCGDGQTRTNNSYSLHLNLREKLSAFKLKFRRPIYLKNKTDKNLNGIDKIFNVGTLNKNI